MCVWVCVEVWSKVNYRGLRYGDLGVACVVEYMERGECGVWGSGMGCCVGMWSGSTCVV